MLTYSKRHDIGYYIASDSVIGASSALEYHARDDGTAAGQGYWWSPSPMSLMPTGSVARPEDVAALAAGRLPPSGRRLVQTQCKDRVVAYDFTMHTAKSISVLYACAPADERQRLLDLHRIASLSDRLVVTSTALDALALVHMSSEETRRGTTYAALWSSAGEAEYDVLRTLIASRRFGSISLAPSSDKDSRGQSTGIYVMLKQLRQSLPGVVKADWMTLPDRCSCWLEHWMVGPPAEVISDVDPLLNIKVKQRDERAIMFSQRASGTIISKDD